MISGGRENPYQMKKGGKALETFIAKEKVPDLIRHLQKGHRVVAPMAKGPTHVFAEVSDAGKVALEYRTTVLPPKKFFMPTKEELMSFDRNAGTAKTPEIKAAPTVFLGLHNYDMQGILRLDFLMKEGNPDKSYLARRESCVFIGTTYVPDENHFSESVGIKPEDREGFDAFLTPAEGGYVLETLTPAGEALLKGFDGGKGKAARAPEATFQRKVMMDLGRIPVVLDKAYGSPVWAEAGEKCFSCGSCNLVCPTCYCFDVEDDVGLDLTTGSRARLWDACQLATFAEVAGGENFREKKEGRIRHRVYRKFRYLNEKYPKPFCVGCGRCNRACTAKINIVEMLNQTAAAV